VLNNVHFQQNKLIKWIYKLRPIIHNAACTKNGTSFFCVGSRWLQGYACTRRRRLAVDCCRRRNECWDTLWWSWSEEWWFTLLIIATIINRSRFYNWNFLIMLMAAWVRPYSASQWIKIIISFIIIGQNDCRFRLKLWLLIITITLLVISQRRII